MNHLKMKASILSSFEHFRETGRTDGITAYNALMPYRQDDLRWTAEERNRLIGIALEGGYEKEMKKAGIL